MKKVKFNLPQFAVSVFLASCFAFLPPYPARASGSGEPQVQTITLKIKCDENGKADLSDLALKLPAGMPAETRAKIVEVLSSTTAKPGETIVMASNDGQAYAPQIKQALKEAKAAAEAMAFESTPSTAVIGVGVLVLILIIIAIALFGSVIYIIYLWARYLLRPPVAPPVAPPPVVLPPPVGITNGTGAISGILPGSPPAMVMASYWQAPPDGAASASLQTSTALGGWEDKARFEISGLKLVGTNLIEGVLNLTVPGQDSHSVPLSIPMDGPDDGWIRVNLSILESRPPASSMFFRMALQ